MRGRKPKPIERAIAEGDPRKLGVGKLQERLERQIKPAGDSLPGCPKHLSGHAKAKWILWRRELEAMGLDSAADQATLEAACVHYARGRDADDEVKLHGLVFTEPITNKDGDVIGERRKPNPAIAISNAAWALHRSFASDLGLSPVSRTRLTLDKKDVPGDQDDLAKLFAEPRPLRSGPIQ